MRNKHIVVTGGAGFIGSNLVRALNQRGEKNIVIVDHLGSGSKWKNLNGLSFDRFIPKQDFLGWLPDFYNEVQTIFHLGACSSTTERDADYLMTNNYQYSKELAKLSVSQGIRFIYASSAATYGDGTQGYDDNEETLEKLSPLNMYGLSKHLFDRWANSKNYFEYIAGLKYFNVFGPGEGHKGDMQSIVPKALAQVQQTGAAKLFKSYHPEFKDGEQQRDFVYVKDIVNMTLFFYDHPEVNGLFNAGTGQARSFNDLVGAVFKALNKTPNIEYIDMPQGLQKQYQNYTQANMQKLKSAGWDGQLTSLEDAVHDYVTNYLKG